jgi:hypothetical protein
LEYLFTFIDETSEVCAMSPIAAMVEQLDGAVIYEGTIIANYFTHNDATHRVLKL